VSGASPDFGAQLPQVSQPEPQPPLLPPAIFAPRLFSNGCDEPCNHIAQRPRKLGATRPSAYNALTKIAPPTIKICSKS
jgi:hypothetical protein